MHQPFTDFDSQIGGKMLVEFLHIKYQNSNYKSLIILHTLNSAYINSRDIRFMAKKTLGNESL